MSVLRTARVSVLAVAISFGVIGCGGGGGSEPKATPTSITITPGPSASVTSGGTQRLFADVFGCIDTQPDQARDAKPVYPFGWDSNGPDYRLEHRV